MMRNDKQIYLLIESKGLKGDKYFVLWIMTHGDEDGKLACNSGMDLEITTLFDQLNDETCVALRGVPKLIFIEVRQLLLL